MMGRFPYNTVRGIALDYEHKVGFMQPCARGTLMLHTQSFTLNYGISSDGGPNHSLDPPV